MNRFVIDTIKAIRIRRSKQLLILPNNYWFIASLLALVKVMSFFVHMMSWQSHMNFPAFR